MNLQKNIWSHPDYYTQIGSWDDLSHPGIKLIADHTRSSSIILDIGCGDGRKLALMGNKRSFRIGTEVSTTPFANLQQVGVVAVGEHLPFADQSIDTITSFFVLEHTQHPQQLLLDALRVLKSKGLLCLLAPNYGAPNRASPNYKKSRIIKLFLGFISAFFPPNSLAWQHVTPNIKNINQFHSDLDTTVEPDLTLLLNFLKNHQMKIIHTSSCWEMEASHPKPQQKLFRFLSNLHIYPFTHWGPHMLVIAHKP